MRRAVLVDVADFVRTTAHRGARDPRHRGARADVSSRARRKAARGLPPDLSRVQDLRFVHRGNTMLIVMKADATEREIAEVVRVINELGFRPHTMPGAIAHGHRHHRQRPAPSTSRASRICRAWPRPSASPSPTSSSRSTCGPRRRSSASATRRSAATSWRSSPAPAPSRAASRSSPSPRPSAAAARASSAAARSSRAPALTPFRVSAKRV